MALMGCMCCDKTYSDGQSACPHCKTANDEQIFLTALGGPDKVAALRLLIRGEIDKALAEKLKAASADEERRRDLGLKFLFPWISRKESDVREP